MSLDPFTSDTLRSMVRHPWPDDRIARYLGVSELDVRRARRRVGIRAPYPEPVRVLHAKPRGAATKWSLPRIRAVLAMLETHSTEATAKHFGVTAKAISGVRRRYA